MIVGRTAGGSPIHYSLPKKSKGKQGKTLYKCSENESHKLTKNQAKTSGFICTHCGADLKVRKEKVRELETLANQLGFELNEVKP